VKESTAFGLTVWGPVAALAVGALVGVYVSHHVSIAWVW